MQFFCLPGTEVPKLFLRYVMVTAMKKYKSNCFTKSLSKCFTKIVQFVKFHQKIVKIQMSPQILEIELHPTFHTLFLTRQEIMDTSYCLLFIQISKLHDTFLYQDFFVSIKTWKKDLYYFCIYIVCFWSSFLHWANLSWCVEVCLFVTIFEWVSSNSQVVKLVLHVL